MGNGDLVEEWTVLGLLHPGSCLRPLAACGTPGPALSHPGCSARRCCVKNAAAVLILVGRRGRIVLGRLGEVPEITLPFWELSITTAGKLTGVLGAFFLAVWELPGPAGSGSRSCLVVAVPALAACRGPAGSGGGPGASPWGGVTETLLSAALPWAGSGGDCPMGEGPDPGPGSRCPRRAPRWVPALVSPVVERQSEALGGSLGVSLHHPLELGGWGGGCAPAPAAPKHPGHPPPSVGAQSQGGASPTSLSPCAALPRPWVPTTGPEAPPGSPVLPPALGTVPEPCDTT